MTSAAFQKALAAHLKGDLDEAVKLYKEVINIDKNNPDALANLGNIYMQLNKKSEALDLTVRAFTINTNNPTYSMNIGAIYLELNNLNQLSPILKNPCGLNQRMH